MSIGGKVLNAIQLEHNKSDPYCVSHSIYLIQTTFNDFAADDFKNNGDHGPKGYMCV